MITVVITTATVPLDQVVREVKTFTDDAAAVAFINEQSALWWQSNHGAASCAELPDTEPYTPIHSLFDWARIELWGGESLFHAMLDHATYVRLHKAHYDPMGDDKPGYMVVAELNGALSK